MIYMAPRPAALQPAADPSKIIASDTLLKDYLKANGVDKTIAMIKSTPGDCHQRSHKVGRLNYELQGNKAFSVLNSECMSGYTHGVTEAFFSEHGTENLTQSLRLICPSRSPGFYAFQCFHGVGHGLMAFNDYDLPASLKDCDRLPPITLNRESCYSGVFMENVVGAISIDQAKAAGPTAEYHASSWLNNDPLYPCDAVDDKYKNTCYGFQTSRMLQVMGTDFQKVAAACGRIQPQYQSNCFSSMGRDISSTYIDDYSSMEQACNYISASAPNLRLQCIYGLAQNKLWDKSQQDDALALCKALQSAAYKEMCYTTLATRAGEIITTHEESKKFCAKYEPKYAQICTAKK